MNSTNVIWINGPINAGKSTISLELIRQTPKSIRIELDDLINYGDSITLNEIIEPCIFDAINLATAWKNRGYKVVLIWPISVEHALLVKEKLSPLGFELLTLLPEYKDCLTERGSRKLSTWEKARMKWMYEESDYFDHRFGRTITKLDLSPADIALNIKELTGF